ncbi:MAG: ion transporter [Lachnospiraceae bacterium]|nr:ion transporter [Lachnospiraceae bacterium]
MEKRNAILSSVFILIVLIVASSLCMYSAENEAQPGVFSNALSGIWWSVNTVFTVGYGDIYPVTTLGRLMAVIITFLGVGAVAIPTGIISAGFVEHYARAQNETLIEDAKKSAVTVLVDEDSDFCGRTVKHIEKSRSICVTAVLRGSTALIPSDDLTVEAGDVVIYLLLRTGA